MYLKTNDKNQMIVETYAMEAYFPVEYMDSAYRGAAYYSLLGTRAKVLGVGNIRFMRNEKELSNPDSVPCYPLGIPMLIVTEPSEIDVSEVKLSKTGEPRKSLILRFFKGDQFMVNTEAIKGTEAMMMILSRLEQGKLDHVPVETAISILRDCERINGINLRIPSEEAEIFVAERYRDPSSPTRKYRYHTGKVADPMNPVSYNTRTDAMKSTTFQGVMHEDINNALIVASNKRTRGEYDEPTMFERVVRGLDLEQYKKADYSEGG